ncbi:AI-2E family transporter [Actinokineospora inagensis]|uniref:AI-2E family transporter n=1 Tax=Actinokineospora inagensis TaxID=103730 RepID=UPI0003FD695B|nr:AI-2E family transporter [Actinokineospora inagensis]
MTGLPRGLVVLLGTAAAVVTMAGVRAAAWLVAPALLALVIVIVASPVHRWLRRRGLPGWAATTVLVLIVYGTLVGFGAVVVVSGARLGSLLPQYAADARDLAADLAGRFGAGEIRQSLRSLDTGKVLSSLGSLLGDVTSLTTSLVFLLALLLFFSVEAAGIDDRLAGIAKVRPELHAALHTFAHRVRRYLVVTTVFGFIIAVLDAFALVWLDIPLAVLWGVLSFVTNYIPNIGFILGVLPPAVLGLLGGGWRRMLAVVLVYVVVNFVVQSLIQPLFVGDSVGLSTTLAFVSLVFWAWILGPLGALLAIPATLLVMALLVETDPRASWVASLLGSLPRKRA